MDYEIAYEIDDIGLSMFNLFMDLIKVKHYIFKDKKLTFDAEHLHKWQLPSLRPPCTFSMMLRENKWDEQLISLHILIFRNWYMKALSF